MYEFKAEKIQERRLKQGLKKSELGKLAGCDPSHISKLESGQRKECRSGLLGRIAGALKVTPNFFFEKVQAK